jgi:hypothetical protein
MKARRAKTKSRRVPFPFPLSPFPFFMSLEIQLRDIHDLKAWERNPRERDPQRFDWIQLSLSKFGFVTPVFAREDGMLYSGHQRTGAARAIGFTQVPVVYLPHYPDQSDRNINILFNLITNDHATRSDYGRKLVSEVADIVELVRLLPDTTDLYPCLNYFFISPADYQDQLTTEAISSQTKNFAINFATMGIDIPIVLDPNRQIINGVNRLAASLEKGRTSVPAVIVSENCELLQAFLNKITMSFDLEKVFGESLRYNSFFRARNQGAQRKILGVGFAFWAFKAECNKHGNKWKQEHCTKLEGADRERWIAEHGTTVIDFGAGRMDNTVKLQESGINCIPFEPYLLKPGTDEITYPGAIMVNKRFLAWVKSKQRLDSVFCSSVFNSVPFADDREHLMVIFQALCSRNSKLFLLTLNTISLKSRLFNNGLNKASRQDNSVMLDGEPGTFIGGILCETAKVQKYHSKEELIAQGQRYFHLVEYHNANSGSHGIKCAGARPIDPVRLVKALEFEFNLPYPEGRRMGLVEQAIAAFSVYCDIDLSKYRFEDTSKNNVDGASNSTPS